MTVEEGIKVWRQVASQKFMAYLLGQASKEDYESAAELANRSIKAIEELPQSAS